MTSREKLARELSCDSWLELRYQGVDGPSHDVTPYVDTIQKAFLTGWDACAERMDAEAAAMRQALEWYVRCDDSTECITNQPCGTVAKEALSSTAGADMLAELKALRKVASRVANGVGIDDLDLIQEARDAREGK